jgi:ankyrin repeat protein
MSVVAVAFFVFLLPCCAVSEDVSCLVSCCDQDGWSALLLACASGHLDVARWLVTDTGSDARSERTKVSCGSSFGCPLFRCCAVSDDVVLLLRSDQNGRTAFLVACAFGYLDVARWLVTAASSDARSERDNVSCPLLCSCASAAGLYRRLCECLRLLGCGAASPRQALRSCLCCCYCRTAGLRSHSPAAGDTGVLRVG